MTDSSPMVRRAHERMRDPSLLPVMSMNQGSACFLVAGGGFPAISGRSGTADPPQAEL